MKKVIFIMAVAALFTACGGGSKSESCKTSCDSTKVDTTKVVKDSVK